MIYILVFAILCFSLLHVTDNLIDLAFNMYQPLRKISDKNQFYFKIKSFYKNLNTRSSYKYMTDGIVYNNFAVKIQ